MGDRRENMKKALGITEYPWSSDDDDAETPGGNEMQQQHSEHEAGQAGVADNPGTSGLQTMSGAPSSSGTGRELPRPQSMFWSVPVMGSRRSPVLSSLALHRSRAARDDMPLSLVSRQPQSASAATGSADVQRILAFRKINRQQGRSWGAPLVMRHAIQRRLAENRANNINRYPVHANPSVTTAMALRRARAIAEMDFTNSNVSVQDYHDALIRADLAEALRSYEQQPSTSRAEPAEPQQPAMQPANLGPPHDVIQALNEQLRNDNGINNAPQNMQPVNLSHPDDSFLEDEHMDQEIPAGEENEVETIDVAIQHNEHDIPNDHYEENDNEIATEEANDNDDSANMEAADEVADGDDIVDGDGGVGGGDTPASVEEVVEIDADEPEVSTPSAQHQNEEPVANTSAAAIDETAVILPRRIKSKMDSDDDNIELGTVKEFNQSLLRVLECPVCLEWMEPPMWQCRRGHLVCGRCRARLAACPVCRTAFSSVRNRAMEGVAEMLRYPCRHGCGRDLQLRRRTTHEASCAARRYRCPAPQCDTRPPIAHKDLAPHFQSKHLSMVKVGHTHTFHLRVNSEQHDNWIILALNQLFHLRATMRTPPATPGVDVDIRTWGVVVYVAYIGPKCYADDYTYEVSVIGQHNARKLIYSRAAHCDLECSSLNMSRQDCFHLTLEQALNFLRVRNRSPEPAKYLTFSVNISRSELSPEELEN